MVNTLIVITIIHLIPVPVYTDQSSQDDYYNHNGKLNIILKDWMSSVGNDIYLHQLSIPATHDTMALYGGPLAQTQSVSLYGQLRAGIRGLDIRCRHIGDKFLIHHGPIYQQANFDHVMTCLSTFLGSNPSEVILMRLKEEHVPVNNTRTFEDTFNDYINQAKYRQYFWRGNYSLIKLGQIRGKIVLLRDFPAKNSIGIPWSRLDLQDEYIVPTLFSIGSKWLKVRQHLEESKINKSTNLRANFLSGTSAAAYPLSIAKRINRYTLEWLEYNQVDTVGLTYMDFPGEVIIQTIVNLNYPMKVENMFHDESILLTFYCDNLNEHNKKRNSFDAIILPNNCTFRYPNRTFGPNKCEFRTNLFPSTTLVLNTTNEHLIVNHFGFYRQRTGVNNRRLIQKWSSL